MLVFFAGGWLGEGEISYAGPNAEARARLAADVIRRRMGEGLEIRFDLIGVLSVFGDDDGRALGRLAPGDARDVRLRVAASSSRPRPRGGPAARGDGPLHLRPGRRRRRADGDHARG